MFIIIEIFDLLSSSSKEPSNTIRIKPIVPNIGSSGFKSGICNWKKSVVCLTNQPKSKSRITEGIFVRGELMSKIYASRSSRQIVIIIAVVIFYLVKLSSSEKLCSLSIMSAW